MLYYKVLLVSVRPPPPSHVIIVGEVSSELLEIMSLLIKYKSCLNESLNELKFYRQADYNRVVEFVMTSYIECYSNYSQVSKRIIQLMFSNNMSKLSRSMPSLYQFIHSILQFIYDIVEGVNAIGDFIISVANIVLRREQDNFIDIYRGLQHHINTILSYHNMSFVRPESYLSYNPLRVLIQYQIKGIEQAISVIQPSVAATGKRVIEQRREALEQLINILGPGI